MIILSWIAVLIAITGVFCLSGKTNRSRLFGFYLMIGTNIFWIGRGLLMEYKLLEPTTQWPIIIQFVVFTMLGVRGINNNKNSTP
ncbi:MAG: hypothetical protein KKB03_00985 [Nanoarchaeota archaeon]|nr:hypothetical protein [Nanoarchaeota archaeon]